MQHQKLIALVGEEEAARILGLAVQTLRNWRTARKGPTYCKISRSVRYKVEDLLDYIESKKITPELA
jgi:hypothetical protein